MKWWVYTDGLVCGPYMPETLARRPSFSRESLVCPDDSQGGAAAQWLKAGNVGTLRAVIEGRPFPPDPTLDDVADHRRLAERLCELESAARRQAAELKALTVREGLLRAELASKDVEARKFNARLSRTGSQLASVKIHEDALRAVMSGLHSHEAEMRELEEHLKALTAAVSEAVDRADSAAAETIRHAIDEIKVARATVARSIKIAEKALNAAEEARAAAGASSKKGRGRSKPTLSPSDLGLPDAVPIEPSSF